MPINFLTIVYYLQRMPDDVLYKLTVRNMELMSFIYVAIGGALGSVARYIAMSYIGRVGDGDFPYGTLAVNIVGSFLMGVWIGYMAALLPDKTRDLHLLLAVGFLGGFTTFSAFSLDFFYMFERGAYGQAGIYALSSVLFSLLALFTGVWLTRTTA